MVKVSDHCLIIPTPPPSSRGMLRSLGAHRYFPSQVPVHLVVNHEPLPRLSPLCLHFQLPVASLVLPLSDSTRDSHAHSILNHHCKGSNLIRLRVQGEVQGVKNPKVTLNALHFTSNCCGKKYFSHGGDSAHAKWPRMETHSHTRRN
jgi:hypothetical protein